MSRGRRRKGKATVISLLILGATTGVVVYLPVVLGVMADLIQDYRGVPSPRDFDPLILLALVIGLALDIVIAPVGLGYAIAFWVRYTRPYRDQLCAKCGYDLRGATESRATCPECGFRSEAMPR